MVTVISPCKEVSLALPEKKEQNIQKTNTVAGIINGKPGYCSTIHGEYFFLSLVVAKYLWNTNMVT